MKKIKVDNNVLIYKICLKAKAKRWSSYKIQHPPKYICKEFYIDLMGLITSTRQNKDKYSFTIINSYSKC